MKEKYSSSPCQTLYYSSSICSPTYKDSSACLGRLKVKKPKYLLGRRVKNNCRSEKNFETFIVEFIVVINFFFFIILTKFAFYSNSLLFTLVNYIFVNLLPNFPKIIILHQ